MIFRHTPKPSVHARRWDERKGTSWSGLNDAFRERRGRARDGSVTCPSERHTS